MTIRLTAMIMTMTMTLQENLSLTPIEQTAISAIVESLKDLVIVNVDSSSQEIKNPISIIEQPLKDDPTSIIESFPSNSNSFSFQLRPASILKQALASLSDVDFNPQGLGLIEVGEFGLEITVCNAKTRVDGHLCLKSTGLINFEFSKPIHNKIINLNHIFDNLVDAAANDTITCHHLDGSSQLTFFFG